VAENLEVVGHPIVLHPPVERWAATEPFASSMLGAATFDVVEGEEDEALLAAARATPAVVLDHSPAPALVRGLRVFSAPREHPLAR
jgi:hypothetical protein